MYPLLNKKLAFFLGLLFFIVTLIWQAPASLLSSAIASHTANHILLTQTQGSIWNGKANVAISSTLGQEQVGQLNWVILASKLLMGELKVEFNFNQSPPSLLTLTTNEISLTHLALEMPASALTHFVPSLNAAQLGGQLQLNSEKISISDDTIQGGATLAWNQVSSPLSPVNPLGQYQALLNGVGNALSIQLSTLNGALQLEGNGNWSMQSGLQFQGYATAQEPHKLALTPLLHILGNEQIADSGKFQFGIQP